MVTNIRQIVLAALVISSPCWASLVRSSNENDNEVLPHPSSEQAVRQVVTFSEPRDAGLGKCEFTHDCRREENLHCKNVQDASCICNHGTCTIRGHQWFGPRQTECTTLQDCKNSGKCNGSPDSQCFCIDEQCQTGTEWECHETSDCGKMEKCRGKDCTCEDGTCEWNCYNDDDCNNGPFYCDPLGYHCKCQNSKCDLVKLPTQCDENSGNGLRECVQKNFCKDDEPCQCLQDYCTKPWYVNDNVEIQGSSRDFNCRTSQDCTDTILSCADGSCECGDIVEHNWNKRGTCIKKSRSQKTASSSSWRQRPDSAIRFPQ